MALIDLSPHFDRINTQLGVTLTIKNIALDASNTDSYGDPAETVTTVTVEGLLENTKGSVDLQHEPFQGDPMYDARAYVPEGTNVFEEDNDQRASVIEVNGREWKVERKDESQNHMIRLDLRRARDRP